MTLALWISFSCLNDIHRAKVMDCDMSMVTDHSPSMTCSKVTQCPGTLVYMHMPLEAISPRPHYSDKIDLFSIGVLPVQVITRTFPAPTDASTCHQKLSAHDLTTPIKLTCSQLEFLYRSSLEHSLHSQMLLLKGILYFSYRQELCSCV